MLLCGSCSWLGGCRLAAASLASTVVRLCDFLLNPFLALCCVAAGAALTSQLDATAAALATQLAAAELLASASSTVAVAVAAATVAGAGGTLLIVLVRFQQRVQHPS